MYLALAESPAWYIGVLAAVSAIFSITVYQGSVLFACVCVLLVLYHLRGQPRPLVSFIATLSLPVLCLALFGGATFWNRIHDFSKAASQGWYSEGTSIPWLYLWSAEHAFFLLLLVGLVAGLRGATRVYSVATLVLYSLMILASFGLNLWPIYGRTARTLLPFFCIAAGGGWHRSFKDLYRLAGDRAIQMRRGLAAAALIQVAFNFAPIVTQKFPAEINREMARYYQFDTAASVGPCPASPAGESKASVTLLNSGYLWPVECFAEERRGRVIYQTRHPFQYEPYSFESYTAPQRDMLKRTDISIRLLQR